MDLAKIIERIKGIILSPKTEWEKIAAEPADVMSLFTGYAAILAVIPAVCVFIGSTVIGVSIPFIGGTYRTPIGAALAHMVLGYVFSLAIVYAVSLVINALAPTFSGEKNPIAALKVIVYSSTPMWIAGVLSLVPVLGVLAIIPGLYGLYLLYLGLSPLMKNPQDKSIGYTALIVVCYIVLAVIVASMVGLVAGGGALMRASL